MQHSWPMFLTEVLGHDITYIRPSGEGLEEWLASRELPEGAAKFLAGLDSGWIKSGEGGSAE